MSAHALASLERYGAFRAAATVVPNLLVFDDGVVTEEVGTAVDDRVGQIDYLILVCPDAVLLPGGDLAHSALLNAFTAQVTNAPKAFALRLPGREHVVTRSASTVPTLAQSTIEEIKALSGLTNEQIAGLMGVSRRSLQAWLAGESISQRKEQRLLALRAALRTMDTGDPVATRRRLMDQAPSCVRVYDLLAAGRFETAVDMATGRRRILPPQPDRPESEGLVAQLNRLEDRVATVEAPSTGRFSRRLRR